MSTWAKKQKKGRCLETLEQHLHEQNMVIKKKIKWTPAIREFKKRKAVKQELYDGKNEQNEKTIEGPFDLWAGAKGEAGEMAGAEFRGGTGLLR